MSVDEFRQHVLTEAGPTHAAAVEAMYPLSDYPSPFDAWAAVLTDASMSCPAKESIVLLSTRDNREASTRGNASTAAQATPKYLYHFVHQIDLITALNLTNTLGVFHGSELPFVFNKYEILVQKERALASKVVGWWDSLAASGVPTEEWPPYSVPNNLSLRIDYVPEVEAGLKEKVCEFWKTIPR